MHTIVIGVGYTGQRVLDRLPAGEATGIRRAELDLDLEDPHIPELPDDYAVLYTVPPRSDADGDPRLATLLGLLHPPPGRIVYLSTTGVYGNRDGDTVSESDTPAPATARASRRLAAETMLREWCAERDTEFVILRVPGIYGPGRVGLERIGAGEPVIVESEAGPGNRIHVDDLATCCIRALSADPPAFTMSATETTGAARPLRRP